MKASKVRAVEMVRKIRDRHARSLAGKETSEIIAFYHRAGEAALENARNKPKPRLQKAS
jgi:hypothetical protein